jgi:hypothetical protein
VQRIDHAIARERYQGWAQSARAREGERHRHRTLHVILMLPGRAGEDPPILQTPSGPSVATPGGLVAVARATAQQPFGPIEQIQPGPDFVDGAAVAIDAATGAAFTTWRNVGAPIGWSVSTPLG